MTDTIPVVEESDVLESAYNKGYDFYADDGRSEPVEEPYRSVGDLKSTARWANSISPRLRALSGFSDETGKGTYSGERPVALVEEGDEADSPAEAVEIGAVHVFQAAVEAFEQGAVDAMKLNDRDATRPDGV